MERLTVWQAEVSARWGREKWTAGIFPEKSSNGSCTERGSRGFRQSFLGPHVDFVQCQVLARTLVGQRDPSARARLFPSPAPACGVADWSLIPSGFGEC